MSGLLGFGITAMIVVLKHCGWKPSWRQALRRLVNVKRMGAIAHLRRHQEEPDSPGAEKFEGCFSAPRSSAVVKSGQFLMGLGVGSLGREMGTSVVGLGGKKVLTSRWACSSGCMTRPCGS